MSVSLEVRAGSRSKILLHGRFFGQIMAAMGLMEEK